MFKHQDMGATGDSVNSTNKIADPQNLGAGASRLSYAQYDREIPKSISLTSNYKLSNMAMGQDMSRLNTPPHWNLWVSCHLTIVHSGRLFGMRTEGYQQLMGTKWRFPRMGATSNHPFQQDFPVNHAAIGDGKPMKAPICWASRPFGHDFHLTAGLDCQFPGRRQDQDHWAALATRDATGVLFGCPHDLLDMDYWRFVQ